jgi:hypothetical protein
LFAEFNWIFLKISKLVCNKRTAQWALEHPSINNHHYWKDLSAWKYQTSTWNLINLLLNSMQKHHPRHSRGYGVMESNPDRTHASMIEMATISPLGFLPGLRFLPAVFVLSMQTMSQLTLSSRLNTSILKYNGHLCTEQPILVTWLLRRQPGY